MVVSEAARFSFRRHARGGWLSDEPLSVARTSGIYEDQYSALSRRGSRTPGSATARSVRQRLETCNGNRLRSHWKAGRCEEAAWKGIDLCGRERSKDQRQ